MARPSLDSIRFYSCQVHTSPPITHSCNSRTSRSTLLMFVAVAHDEEFGPTPKSIHDEKERQNIANRAKEEDQAPMIALAESRQVVPSNRHLGIEQRGGI